MKKKYVLSMIIIVFVLLLGIFAFSNIEHKEEDNTYAPYEYLVEEVADLRSTFAEMFLQNQETFISIAEQLYVEDSRIIVYDSTNKTIKNIEDIPQNMDENLILKCFEIMEEQDLLGSTLMISKYEMYGEYSVVDFTFRVPKINIDVGIMYSEQHLPDYQKLCDNWYVFQHGLV